MILQDPEYREIQHLARARHLSIAEWVREALTVVASRLLQPVQRLTPGRSCHQEGLGLGLSIVAAIAGAHGARLELTANPTGGLSVRVAFPPVRGDQPSPGDDGAAPVPEAKSLARIRA